MKIEISEQKKKKNSNPIREISKQLSQTLNRLVLVYRCEVMKMIMIMIIYSPFSFSKLYSTNHPSPREK